MITDALAAIADVLSCPHCGLALLVRGETLACASGHSFDVARQGYVSLLPSGARATTGDSAAMVAARSEFLARGHYGGVMDAVVASIPPGVSGRIADVAGGTGAYLAAVLDARPALAGVSLDLSPFAARRAARAHPRLASVVADVWRALPLRDATVTHLLSIFGPRNADEFVRVLAAGGGLTVVTPSAAHLREIRGPLGMLSIEDNKSDRLATQLAAFRELSLTRVEYQTTMDHGSLRNEVLMGPSAHHVTPAQLDERLDAIERQVRVTVSVEVRTFEAAP